jgi:uncharacterized protein
MHRLTESIWKPFTGGKRPWLPEGFAARKNVLRTLSPSAPRLKNAGHFFGHYYLRGFSFLSGERQIDLSSLKILFIIFVATLIRSAFGFGEALIAVPLLAFLIPLTVAAPLAVLVSITVAAIVIVQDWKHIHLSSTAWLVVPTLLGIPLGILLLKSSHQGAVKAALGAIIIAFSLYSLIGRAPVELKRDSQPWLLICGFLAGILGGAYGMNGPPLAIYGTMRRWSAQQFRATLQGYFLPASIIGMCGYWITGLWTWPVTHYYLLSLPATLLGVLGGRVLNRRMHGERFAKYVYVGLAGIGVLLLAQAITGRL